MSIFDLFGLKTKLREVFSKENIEELIGKAKDAIIAKVPSEEEGAKKKAYVDNIVKGFLINKASCYSGIAKWVLESLLTAITPVITQLVYDHLKAKVENLTQA